MTAPELLRQHINSQGVDDQEFAARIGVSKGTISLWLSGHIRPSGSSALLLQSATGGAVPFAAWYADAPPDRRKNNGARKARRSATRKKGAA